jgi:hypothetical protein
MRWCSAIDAKSESEMDITQVNKKIAEARFFLRKMAEYERRIIGDREPFDYYLSAFLSAGRTIDYRLRHEQSALYTHWREAWDAHLTPEESCLIKFMVDDRNDEVHESGSSRTIAQDAVEFSIGTHHVDGGTLTIGGHPGIADKPTYYFTIGGVERKATEACVEYLELLQRMVTQFETDHP